MVDINRGRVVPCQRGWFVAMINEAACQLDIVWIYVAIVFDKNVGEA